MTAEVNAPTPDDEPDDDKGTRLGVLRTGGRRVVPLEDRRPGGFGWPDSGHGAPSLPLYVSESFRAAAEYGALVASAPLLPTLPRGDGHAVLVIPGILTTDASTASLRWVLTALGYHVRGWSLGWNVGPTARVARELHRRLDVMAEHHGGPVSVIGWSLGGIYARTLARVAPDVVRQVITLGSPFRLTRSDQNRAHRNLARESHLHLEHLTVPLDTGPAPLTVPSSSIYSRLDGVVSWRACLDDVTDRSENIEVLSSHVGMGHHPAVVWAVADRLAQPEGAWRPFRPPAVLKAAFPAV
jgi:pimeloyl-ACP methyl ester carboxylesterase